MKARCSTAASSHRPSASWPSSTFLTWPSCSAVNALPTPANSVSHIDTYSSIMPGTAGSVICPLTSDRRSNRRASASRTASTDRRGDCSIDAKGR
jgi:hypothetical protein